MQLGHCAWRLGAMMKRRLIFKQWSSQANRETAFDSEVKGMLEEINLKETFLANPVPYDPRPARNVNTRWDEYLGALTPDGSQFYFTRRSKKRNKYEGPASPLRSVEEFSLANTLSSANSFLFEEGTSLSAPFNTKYNEGGPTITADNRLMVFTICERDKRLVNRIVTCTLRHFLMACGTAYVQFPMSISQGAGKVNRPFLQWRCSIFLEQQKRRVWRFRPLQE